MAATSDYLRRQVNSPISQHGGSSTDVYLYECLAGVPVDVRSVVEAKHRVSVIRDHDATSELRADHCVLDVHDEVGVDGAANCIDGSEALACLTVHRRKVARQKNRVIVHRK